MFWRRADGFPDDERKDAKARRNPNRNGKAIKRFLAETQRRKEELERTR
jgi:hypothetical protein